jgi:hypothetical protein
MLDAGVGGVVASRAAPLKSAGGRDADSRSTSEFTITCNPNAIIADILLSNYSMHVIQVPGYRTAK